MTAAAIWPLALKPHAVQQEAINRANGRAKYGYFMEQGLGKTATAYADFVVSLMKDQVEAAIVLAPNYLKSGWQDEAEKWGVKVPVHIWESKQPFKQLLKPPFILVVNYDAIRGPAFEYVEKLMEKHKCMLILDESSSIKNPGSETTRHLSNLRGLSPNVRLLDGLPMSQNIIDLYPQFRFLGEIPGMNPFAFKARYAKMGGYMGKQVVGIVEDRVAEVHAILNRCSFRALKADWWADMPKKVYELAEFEMGKRQKEAYLSMLEEFYAFVEEKANAMDVEVFAEQAITMQMKLQQISRGFIIDNEGEAHDLVPYKDNPALKAAKFVVSRTPGKTIVFAYYKHSVDMLEKALGFPAMRGGMSTDEMRDMKRRFNEDPKTRGIVAQLDVGHRGHTLLGSGGENGCYTSMFFENTYRLLVREQAEDRNHRFGQDSGFVTYWDLYGSHIDKKMAQSLAAKRSLVDAVVNAVRSRPKAGIV